MKSRLAQPGIFCIAAVLGLSPMIALADPPPAHSGEELEPLPPPTSAPAPSPTPKRLLDSYEEEPSENKPADTQKPVEATKKSKETWSTHSAPPPDPANKPEEKVMRSPNAFAAGIATVVVSSIVVGFCIAGFAGAPYDPKPSTGKLGMFFALGLLGGGIGSLMIYYGGEKVRKEPKAWQRAEPGIFIGEDRTQLGFIGRF